MNYSTQSEGYKVQASVKLGRNGQHMLNVRADTVDELLQLMDKLNGSSAFINESVEGLANPDSSPNEAQAVANIQAQFPTTQQIQPGVIQPQQPQTYGQQPTNPDVCPGHGLPWKPISGVKNGKQWSGLFCTGPQNGPIPQCKPIFS